MSIYVEYVEDSHGDIIDVLYFCSTPCRSTDAFLTFDVEERDACTFCAECGELMAHGLQCAGWQDDDDALCDGGIAS